MYRAIERSELTASVVCSRLRIHPDDLPAWMDGESTAAIPSQPRTTGQAAGRVAARKKPDPDGLRSLRCEAKLGGMSVERVQRKSGVVWRVRWRENGQPAPA